MAFAALIDADVTLKELPLARSAGALLTGPSTRLVLEAAQQRHYFGRRFIGSAWEPLLSELPEHNAFGLSDIREGHMRRFLPAPSRPRLTELAPRSTR